LSKKIVEAIEDNKKDFFSYLNRILNSGNNLYVKGGLLEILESFKNDRKDSNHKEIEKILRRTTESVCYGNYVYFEFREKIGDSDYYLFNVEGMYYEKINAAEYLSAKEQFVNHGISKNILTLNFSTFYDKFPSIREPKSIGRGVEYLNRYLSSTMFTNPGKLSRALFDFLFLHKYKNQQLIVNGRIDTPEKLSASIDNALSMLRKIPEDEPYKKFRHSLQELGFERGLGNKASSVIESLEMLDRLMLAPDHQALRDFLSRIPMIFNIVVVSPHGYFGQDRVLGRPDTGGQVVYILDQVKALEKAMIASLEESGLEADPKIIILTRLIPNAGDTSCNQRLEKVHETSNSWILRVPFRTFNKNITDNWISRFEIWPYLESFAEDSGRELLAEFGQRPDFIIGNYSDGNIVGYMLAKEFGVTQCNIAHALEKSKYLYSNLYWKDMEDHYHFSVQYTADLISMNAANFIITSTYQEIAGTEESIGQYESYKNFTMPDLYRVTGGINLFHPKFNIVPPGVNSRVYFPYTQAEDRIKETEEYLYELIFRNMEDPDVVGKLENPDLIPVFSMARLDRIKNLTSLVRWFGESEELQETANLIIVAGSVDINNSADNEEREQIETMYRYVDEYNLYNRIRWIGKLFRKDQAGELYRLIADRKGIFVQPALFEGFGLTVLEAMRSGLPVFATMYGGPLEIIQEGKSGFHIDPINQAETTRKILDFIKSYKKNPEIWERISSKSIERVDRFYNWDLYAGLLLSLAKIYGFWKFTSNIEMEELNAYLEVLYNLLYKPRANEILEIHNSR